jgi:hypothetical protein
MVCAYFGAIRPVVSISFSRIERNEREERPSKGGLFAVGRDQEGTTGWSSPRSSRRVRVVARRREGIVDITTEARAFAREDSIRFLMAAA